MTTNPYTPDEIELRDCYAASLHEHAGTVCAEWRTGCVSAPIESRRKHE
ncbi:MAG: hypothetical protein ACTIIH_01710 [Brevibacterium sp.]